MPYNKSFIDQASSAKMAGYWPRSLFAFVLDFVSVHKNAKRELGQYPAILTLRLVNNIYLLKTVCEPQAATGNDRLILPTCLGAITFVFLRCT